MLVSESKILETVETARFKNDSAVPSPIWYLSFNPPSVRILQRLRQKKINNNTITRRDVGVSQILDGTIKRDLKNDSIYAKGRFAREISHGNTIATCADHRQRKSTALFTA